MESSSWVQKIFITLYSSSSSSHGSQPLYCTVVHYGIVSWWAWCFCRDRFVLLQNRSSSAKEVPKRRARSLPPKFMFSHPVVLESICYRTTAKRLKYEGNATGKLKNTLDGLETKSKHRTSLFTYEWKWMKIKLTSFLLLQPSFLKGIFLYTYVRTYAYTSRARW